MPVGPDSLNWAVTGYGAFYHYTFGPGYLRYEGSMSAATGEAGASGSSAARPLTAVQQLLFRLKRLQ